MYRVTFYKYGFDPQTLTTKNKNKKLKLNLLTESSISRSVRRTRRTLFDYILCNEFDWFVTFTFDPKKVNRYDEITISLKMRGWLSRQVRKNPDFKYVITMEHHKDGAIHYHACIAGYQGAMKRTNVLHENKRVYNITGFRFGFTTATKIDDRNAAAGYIMKYITKDMTLILNKRRYWSSLNLNKPITHYNKTYDLGINTDLNPSNVINETDYNVIYQVKKPFFD